jgi:hypothetical protein
MTTTNLAEHTITVAGKPIFVAETGSGHAARRRTGRFRGIQLLP